MTDLEANALIALLRSRAGELRFLELAGVSGAAIERLRRELGTLRTQLEATVPGGSDSERHRLPSGYPRSFHDERVATFGL